MKINRPPQAVLSAIDGLGHDLYEGHPWGLVAAPTSNTTQMWPCRRCARSAIEALKEIYGTATVERCEEPRP